MSDHGTDLKSALGLKSLELGPVVSAGALGQGYQRKNRGRFQTIGLGSNWVRLLDVVGEDQLGATTTIACSLRRAQSFTPAEVSILPSVVGRLDWGTDGAAHVAEFDFINGTMIAAAGSAFRVDVRIEADPAELGSVIALCSIGYLPSKAQAARRTRSSPGPIAALASVVHPVPAFASLLEVVRTADPFVAPSIGFDVGVVVRDAALTPIAALTTAGAAVMRLPQGSAFVEVFNLSTVPQSHRAIFTLWI
jgi:hypothetical protein